MSDIFILLPGITGSVLRKDGKAVWAPSEAGLLNALVSLGDNIKDLRLGDDPPELDDLGDGVTADELVPDVHIIPGLWKIDGYSRIRDFVVDKFKLEAGKSYFDFPYDWRRDNRVAARKLSLFARARLTAWRESSGDNNAKLILLCHSMGGLVARYFLEAMDGWECTRALISFGTPYRGSLNALNSLANGQRVGAGPATLLDLSDLIRSLTSVYQLLPIYPCFDNGTDKLQRLVDVTLPNMDALKIRAAMAFHDEIRNDVTAHLADETYLKSRYAICPVVGLNQPTRQSARFAGGKVEFADAYEGEDMSGDGTVPRVSAIPIELDDKPSAMYAAQRHASLQNLDAVLTQIEGIVTTSTIPLGTFRLLCGEKADVSLSISDTYDPGQPISITARLSREVPLTAILRDSTGKIFLKQAMTPDDQLYRAEFSPQPPGTYRVTVGSSDANPVTDIFLVLGPPIKTGARL